MFHDDWQQGVGACCCCKPGSVLLQRNSDAARKVLAPSSVGTSSTSPSACKESVAALKESRPTLLTGSSLLAIAQSRQQKSCTTPMKVAASNGSKQLGPDEFWAAKRCKISPESCSPQPGVSKPLQTVAIGVQHDTKPKAVSSVKEVSVVPVKSNAPVSRLGPHHRSSAKAVEAAGRSQRLDKHLAGRKGDGKIKPSQKMSGGSGLMALVEDDIF